MTGIAGTGKNGARGDVNTLLAHYGALAAAPERIRNLYKASARQAVDMAERQGLPRERAAQIEECLR